MAEIRGERFDAVLLRRAAGYVEGLGPDAPDKIARLVNERRLTDVPDLAPVSVRIRELHDARDQSALKGAIEGIPRDLRNLIQAGLPVQLALEICRLGATSSGDLAAVIRDGRLARELASSPEVADAIHRAQPQLRWAQPRIPLGRADGFIEWLLPELRDACPELLQIEPVGSFRRGDATIGDLQILAVARAFDQAVECLVRLPLVTDVLHRSERAVTLRIRDAEVDVRLVSAAAFPFALLHYTGSATHNEQLRQYALDHGFVLTSIDLRRVGHPDAVRCASEEEVYAALGLPFVPPEMREGGGEIEAAARGALPTLVCQTDIRGDLHLHSTWSDGRDSIAEMVKTARELGYEYVAITDHSQSAAASRVLTVDAVARQREEIERVRREVPGITLLHGVEVDILPDGSLDFPDALLEGLDIVLASLHDPVDHSGEELTERYIAAMRHPLVNVLTHPANRLVGRREGYDLDLDRLFRAAVETRTYLEIDGAPGHLDMDGPMARQAIAAGVGVAIDSDCHKSEWLHRQMRFGIGMARRGWVEPRHVLNTGGVEAVREAVRRKRANGAKH